VERHIFVILENVIFPLLVRLMLIMW